MCRTFALVVLAVVVSGVTVQIGWADCGGGWSRVCEGYSYVGVSPKNTSVPPSAQYDFCFLLWHNGQPVVGFPASQVELRFTACSEPSTRPLNEIPADADSDEYGRVFWREALSFGGADPCQIDVLVQNVVFHSIPPASPGGLRSPDTTGDGLVALDDLSEWQTAFATGGPTYIGDLGPMFDGAIGLSDLVTWQIHFTAP